MHVLHGLLSHSYVVLSCRDHRRVHTGHITCAQRLHHHHHHHIKELPFWSTPSQRSKWPPLRGRACLFIESGVGLDLSIVLYYFPLCCSLAYATARGIVTIFFIHHALCVSILSTTDHTAIDTCMWRPVRQYAHTHTQTHTHTHVLVLSHSSMPALPQDILLSDHIEHTCDTAARIPPSAMSRFNPCGKPMPCASCLKCVLDAALQCAPYYYTQEDVPRIIRDCWEVMHSDSASSWCSYIESVATRFDRMLHCMSHEHLDYATIELLMNTANAMITYLQNLDTASTHHTQAVPISSC